MSTETLSVKGRDLKVGDELEVLRGVWRTITGISPSLAGESFLLVDLDGEQSRYFAKTGDHTIQREVPTPTYKPGTLVDVNGDDVPLLRLEDGSWVWLHPTGKLVPSMIFTSDDRVTTTLHYGAKIVFGGGE